jgi:hypothetical protein
VTAIPSGTPPAAATIREGGVNGTSHRAIVSSDGADGVVTALNLRSAGDPQLPALADRLLCGSR